MRLWLCRRLQESFARIRCPGALLAVGLGSARAQRAQCPAALPAATSPACGFEKDLVVLFSFFLTLLCKGLKY